MPNDLDPIVDQWYRNLEKGQRFYVTNVDEDAGLVEVQHYDSGLEEFTLSEWRDLDIDLSEQPEQWTGPLDLPEQDDLGQEALDTNRDDWESPAQEFQREDERQLTRNNPPYGRSKGEEYGEGHIEEDLLENSDDADGTPEANNLDSNVERRPDGVYEETFNDDWYAEYLEDPDSGLWRADVYMQDIPEWREGDFESLEDARLAAREWYSQSRV